MAQTTQTVIAALMALLTALSAQVGDLTQSVGPTSQLAQVIQTATLTLAPSSASASVNNTFTVNIVLNTAGQSAYGVDINRIRFNPAILQVVDADAVTVGVQIAAGTIMPFNIKNSVDNTGGSIEFSQLANPGSTFSGSGTLASVTFRAVSVGATNVTFDFTLGSGIDTNVAGLGGDLLSSVSNGSYTGVALDTTAPTISGVAISGVTSSGATISWTTNEPANTQVDYGLTASYGSTALTASGMVTSHTVTLSGLSAGTAYHYRVKSRDAAGNLTPSSDNMFTTQMLPDTTTPLVPGGVIATSTSETQIQLSWTASTDPTGVGQIVSGVTNYQIFRGGVLINTTGSTAYLNSGLTAGLTYSYQVAAVDSASNVSARSGAVSITTPIASLLVQRRLVLVLEGAPVNQRNVSGTVEFLNPASNLSSKIYQASFATDSSGRYTIDVPAGILSTVTFRPVISGYLSKLLPNVDLRNMSILDANFSTLPAGDFNDDQLINSLDFSYMNNKWNLSDALADISRDGVVNSLDFAYLSNNWLLTGE
ncbi:MAG: fibronectin type III domain-containing protein [bacterium]|nr:fibronectin type III domain-containing protein [bacterium]